MPGDKQHPTTSDLVARRLDALIVCAQDDDFSGPEVGDSPLLINSRVSHLDANALAADWEDSDKPSLLRRAISYIDQRAHTDITVSDVAAHVYVTPRALQYMFRRHVDCTPTEYLRQVRLNRAHTELLAATRSNATVAAIARRWGFTHVGRFAVYYRNSYGQSPHTTLWN